MEVAWAEILSAARALDSETDRVPTALVLDSDRWSVWVSEVGVAPLHQCDQNRLDVPALLGQQVLPAGSLSLVLIRACLHDAGRNQLAEPVREHRAGQADVALEVLKPANSVDCITEDQQGPFVAEDVQRPLDRAVLRAEVQPVHDSDRAGWGGKRNLTIRGAEFTIYTQLSHFL